jgi:hypothetical protein
MLRRALAGRRTAWLLPALAVLLMLPTLGAGWHFDDLVQRAHIVDRARLDPNLASAAAIPPDSSRLAWVAMNLYSHVRAGRPDEVMVNMGALPWWAAPGLRVSFWRPVAATTHWVDYRLFSETPWATHLHSVLWFAAGASLLAALYRRLIAPAWAAGLAGMLYVLDEAWCFPVMYVANRHILVSFALGVCALLAFVRWRRSGDPGPAVACHALLALAVLACEAAVTVVGYMFAYEVFLDAGPRRRRAAALAPSIALVAVWRVVYNALGHGAVASADYVDPVRTPLRFADTVLARGPLVLFSQWACQPAEAAELMGGPTRAVVLAAAVLFLTVSAVVLLPLVRRDRTAAFWLTGMVLAAVPTSAAGGWGRSLFFVAVGAFGLMAQFLAGMADRAEWRPHSRLWRAPAGVLLALLVLANVVGAAAAHVAAPGAMARGMRQLDGTLTVTDVDDLTGRDLVLVTGANGVSWAAP